MSTAWCFFRLQVATCLLTLFGFGGSIASAEETKGLKIFTDGGAYQLSQEKAFFKPFEQETGTPIISAAKGDAVSLLKKWYGSSRSEGDVINLTSFEAEKACELGLLHSFTEEDIAPGANGQPIMQDFFPNSLMDCAVPNVAWAALMVVKPQKSKRKQARSWADFFNVKKFPGKRSLKKSARFTLELALLSAGVKAGDVYEHLSTIAGQKKAFAQLEKLKDNIVWWDEAKASLAAFQQDDVQMGLAFNGRLFNAIVADGVSAELVWRGHIYDFDYWAIPLKTHNHVQALAFVKFATAPQRLAAQAKWMPYGPMRVSAQSFIKTHKIGKMPMKPFVPTAQKQFLSALKFNEAWWHSEIGKALETQFANWLEGKLTWPEVE